MIGRLTIIKSLALSKFTYLFIALPNPPPEFNLIKYLVNLVLYKFFLNNGPDRIKEVRLRMINTSYFIKALKIS